MVPSGSRWPLGDAMPNGRNRAFGSYRHAAARVEGKPKENPRVVCGAGALRIYPSSPCIASLGVDGKGKAPHWTLTECGQTSRASAEGLFEPPTNDFLKWDGILV